jgi:hypothetical protein
LFLDDPLELHIKGLGGIPLQTILEVFAHNSGISERGEISKSQYRTGHGTGATLK